MTRLLHGFPPLAMRNARRLVLGSMPGAASLAAQQYYAHPRNAFWRVMETLFAVPATLPYEQRCKQLTAHGIAVWDVLAACTRSGSLDSAIEEDSIVANDFVGFLQAHQQIDLICFNGAKAAEMWRRHVVPMLPQDSARIPVLRLPSTSPAHAGMVFGEKVARWQQGLAVRSS